MASYLEALAKVGMSSANSASSAALRAHALGPPVPRQIIEVALSELRDGIVDDGLDREHWPFQEPFPPETKPWIGVNLVVGEAGSGKTTELWNAAVRCALQGLADLREGRDARVVRTPILVHCRRLLDRDLQDALIAEIEDALGRAGSPIDGRAVLASGGSRLLLVDGFDRVLRSHRRDVLIRLEEYRQIRAGAGDAMVIAMRPDALPEFQPTRLPVSAAWRIDPLTTEGRRTFVTTRSPSAVTEANNLLALLKENAGLQVAAGNPTLLGLLCRLHTSGRLSSQSTAAEALDHALDLVLDEGGGVSHRGNVHPTSISPRGVDLPRDVSETRASLARAAWELYRKDPSSMEFRESEFVEGLGTAVPDGGAGAFLNRLETLGLIVAQWPQCPGDRTFAWSHPAFVAHLAARHVARQGEDWRSMVAPFLWQETAMVSRDPLAPGGSWYRWNTAAAPFFQSLGWCLAHGTEPKPGTSVAQLIRHLVREETRCRSAPHFETMLLLASLVLTNLPTGALPDDPEVQADVDQCARAVVAQFLTHGRWAWRGHGMLRSIDPREIATFPAARALLRSIVLADLSFLRSDEPPRSQNRAGGWRQRLRFLSVRAPSPERGLADAVRSGRGLQALRVLALLGDREILPQIRLRLGSFVPGAQSKEVIEVLSMLEDPESNAGSVLGNDPESLLRLRHLAEFADQPMLQAQAIRELGVLGDRESAQLIRTLVKDDSHESVLEAAIRALGRMGDYASIPTLRALIRDRLDLKFLQTRGCRFEPAVKSLIQLRDPDLLALLRTYLRDGKDTRTVQYAIWSLTRFDDLGALPVLRELMVSCESLDTRAAAINALATLAGMAALPDIRPLVDESPTYPVRLAAVSAVGWLRDAECLPTLRQLANPSHPKTPAMTGERDLGGAQPLPKPKVQEFMDLRERAVIALARIGQPEDAPLIARHLLEGWNRTTHPDCIEALVRGGVDGTFEILRQMLHTAGCNEGLPEILDALVRLGHAPMVREKYPGEANSQGCLRRAVAEGWFV